MGNFFVIPFAYCPDWCIVLEAKFYIVFRVSSTWSKIHQYKRCKILLAILIQWHFVIVYVPVYNETHTLLSVLSFVHFSSPIFFLFIFHFSCFLFLFLHLLSSHSPPSLFLFLLLLSFSIRSQILLDPCWNFIPILFWYSYAESNSNSKQRALVSTIVHVFWGSKLFIS